MTLKTVDCVSEKPSPNNVNVGGVIGSFFLIKTLCSTAC